MPGRQTLPRAEVQAVLATLELVGNEPIGLDFLVDATCVTQGAHRQGHPEKWLLHTGANDDQWMQFRAREGYKASYRKIKSRMAVEHTLSSEAALEEWVWSCRCISEAVH